MFISISIFIMLSQFNGIISVPVNEYLLMDLKRLKQEKTRKIALRGTYTYPRLVSFLKYKHILKILDLNPKPGPHSPTLALDFNV